MLITYQFDYQQELEKVYNESRWEAYYDPVLLPVLSSCCDGLGVKVVPTHETRKRGIKKHFIETYSIAGEKEVKKEKNGKEVIERRPTRLGIPDFVIVPEKSTYDNPLPSIVNVEFKLPINLTSKYIKCNPEEHKTELRHQFEYCKYNIFTDGVTWYLLKKSKDDKKAYTISKCIELYDYKKNQWKRSYRNAYDENEKDFFDSLGIKYDKSSMVECQPPEWEELMETIIETIKIAKNNNQQQ